jgi:Ni,Fe-hydrogenase I cytochrome b subunit
VDSATIRKGIIDMESPLILSPESLRLAGVLLLTVVAIESGGYYMLSLWTRRNTKTAFQIGFARAGHAHAGVLVILSLVIQIYVDAAGMTGVLGAIAREGVPAAAILMPAGFFLSSIGAGRTSPNRLIWLTIAGTVTLAAGVIATGFGLVTAA